MIDFDEAYAEHHAALLRTTTRRCNGDLQTAADICSEAWAKAWRLRESYDPARGNVRQWLHRICRSVTIDHFRRERLRLFPRLDCDPPDDDPPDPPDVASALDALPADLAGVVRVVYLEGRPLREAAGVLHRSRTTVQNDVREGLAKLRKILAA